MKRMRHHKDVSSLGIGTDLARDADATRAGFEEDSRLGKLG